MCYIIHQGQGLWTEAIVTDTLNNEDIMKTVRTITACALLPFMYITGFRFSKDYRWESTLYHKLVYRLCDTVKANILAITLCNN